jgi:hypothetical protein
MVVAGPFSDLHHAVRTARHIWFNLVYIDLSPICSLTFTLYFFPLFDNIPNLGGILCVYDDLKIKMR